ncbi:S8 family serine peptidase [Paenibacillus sepulcri]
MQKLERLLKSCIKDRADASTRRTVIGFKQRSQYIKAVKELSSAGIHPIKSIQESKAICCHLNAKQKNRLKALNNHPHIQYVEEDFKIKAHSLPAASRSHRKRHAKKQTEVWFSPQRITWNIRRVKAPRVWPLTLGKTVGIGIIDTGIAKHPDLHIAGGVNTINGRSYRDDNGHGTHVAGIAAALGTKGQIPGVAPRASLYAVKALDANGEGYLSDIIEGINWCIEKNIPVINMSLGLEGGTSLALREAVRRASRKGIVIAASAGNNGRLSGGIDEPAKYRESIAVAASTRSNRIAPYSSRGKGIAVTAPGSDIKSTWLDGGYKILSGTSMSSPHAAGTAALLLSLEPRLTPSAVKRRLEAAASHLPGYSRLSQGYGLLNVPESIRQPYLHFSRRRLTGSFGFNNSHRKAGSTAARIKKVHKH